MAGSFRIAEGYVEVTADQSSYDRQMERLKSTRHTVKIGLTLDKEQEFSARLARLTQARTLRVRLDLDKTALSRLKLTDLKVNIKPVIPDAALQRVRTQLDRLTADRSIIIRPSVDTRVAADEIRNLTRRQRVRIGVDVDTRVAADDIANLTRRRTMTVAANADTAAARARIDALARNRTANIDVNVRSGGLSALTSGGSALSGMSSSISTLAAAAVGALPTLASLGSSLIQMGPLAAVAAPAVLSLATAFAAIKIGTSGVGDAFKAAFAPAAQGASTALSSAKSVESAQRSLAKAVQAEKDAEVNAAAARVKAARDVKDAQLNLKNTVSDVADSNRRAAESVAQAERDLTTAQKAATQAQKDLTQARKDAAAELVDLNNQLEDAQLSQRQDVLNLSDAEKQLAADKAAGASVSADQLAKDQLAYDQALQALEEQQLATQRLQDQTDAANKAGVEGSSTVTAAKQTVADATQTTADKEQALNDQQIAAVRQQVDGAQQIAKAQRDLSDAQAAQTKTAADGARSVADAQDAITQAAQALAEAQQSAAIKTGTLSTALAKLSPNARAFVTAVVAQRAAWTALRLDVQDTLFAGLSGRFTTMANAALPALRTGLVGTAGVLNTMAKNALAAVTNLAKAGTLKAMFAGLNSGLAPLARIPGQFITALSQLSVAASPAFQRITAAAGSMADGIMAKLSGAFKSGGLTDAINSALGIAKQFGSLIADIAGTLGNVFKAAAASGGDALGLLGNLFDNLRRVTALPEVQDALKSIFTAINTIAKLLAGTLGTALAQLVTGLAPIATAITQVLNGLGDTGPLMGGLIAAFNPFLGILTLLAPMLGDLAKPIVGLVKSLGPMLGMLSEFASGLMTALTPVIGGLIGVLSGVLLAIAPVLGNIIPVILQVVTAIAGPLADVMAALVPLIGPLLQVFTTMDLAMLPLAPQLIKLIPPIAQLTVALANLALQVITPLLPLITGLSWLLSGVLSVALSVLIPVITTVISWITALANALSASIKFIVDSLTWLWTKTKQIFTALASDVSKIWSALWSKVRSAWNSFWSWLPGAINSARSWIGNAFSGLRTTVSNTWSGLWNGVSSKFTTVIGGVRTAIGNFASGTKTVFSSLRDSLGSIWDGIKSKFSAPVKFVVGTVYNNGIRKMWDTIAGKVGLPQLPAIKLGFNTGGVVPGTGTRDTVDAKLTPGERVLSLPQVAQLGGHRGIDAMLGKDHPTGTGGNPTTTQDRKMQQPVPRFGLGGIVSDVTGAVSGAVGGAVDWAKGLVVGGLQAAARKAIGSLVQPLINRIPGGGVGDLMKGLSGKALDGILGKLGKEDDKAVGGPAVQKALSWAKSQAGKLYQWGGNGNPSWDCSGLMSAIESVIRGESPHRRWATGSFSGSTAPDGWVRNLVSPFMIGVTNAGVGHTAGTLAGVNVESQGTLGVLAGSKARGYGDGLFQNRYGFKPAAQYDQGGLLQPGATMAVNKTGRPERILDPHHTAALDAMLAGGGSGGITIEAININGTFDFSTPAARRQAANELVDEMNEALRTKNRSRNR